MSAAQVTEAHLLLAEQLIQDTKLSSIAQLIADSEAKAIAGVNASLDAAIIRAWGISAERDQLRADRDYNHECINRLATATGTLGEKSERVVEVALSTIDQLRAEVATLRKFAEQVTDRNEEMAKLRAEVERLREWQAGVIANERLHHAERKDAIARAEKAESELAGIRALANRRNKRDHSQDTTHQLVVALDQALDIVQAELAATKSTLDEEVNCAEKVEHEVVRQYIRAERAEAELAEQKYLKESSVKRAKELTEELAAANAKLLRNESDGYLCELERTRAELAAERAKARVLRDAVEKIDDAARSVQDWGGTHLGEEIDKAMALAAAMKEGAK